MSDQLTSQSRSSESVISRRTALRGAAWSASAVTVVVATPNIAAATPGTAIVPTTTVVAGTPIKFSRKDDKFVAWDLSISSSNMDLEGLALHFTYDQAGGGTNPLLSKVTAASYSSTPSPSWTAEVTKASMIATAVATCATRVAKGNTVNVHVEFSGTDNSEGKVGVTVMAKNSAGGLVAVATAGATSWDSDKEHSH